MVKEHIILSFQFLELRCIQRKRNHNDVTLFTNINQSSHSQSTAVDLTTTSVSN
jgi:hypothetical protein